jgi:hypothetical protein
VEPRKTRVGYGNLFEFGTEAEDLATLRADLLLRFVMEITHGSSGLRIKLWLIAGLMR